MKNAVFWDVASCRSQTLPLPSLLTPMCPLSLPSGSYIAGSFRLVASLHPPAHAGSSLADFSTLKMEAIRSSETSVQSTRSTRRHILEDGILRPYVVFILTTSLNKQLKKSKSIRHRGIQTRHSVLFFSSLKINVICPFCLSLTGGPIQWWFRIKTYVTSLSIG
jgi:hypothetical protein